MPIRAAATSALGISETEIAPFGFAKKGDPLHAGECLLEQLQPLVAQTGEELCAGHIAAACYSCRNGWHWRPGAEKPDNWHRGLLRVRSERPHRRGAADKANELTSPHIRTQAQGPALYRLKRAL